MPWRLWSMPRGHPQGEGTKARGSHPLVISHPFSLQTLLKWLLTAVLKLGTPLWHWKYELWLYVWTSPQPNNPWLGKASNSLWSRGSVLIPDCDFFILTEKHCRVKYMCSSAIENLPILSVPWLINLVVISFLCGKVNNRGWTCAAGWLQENGLSSYHLWNCYTYNMKLCQLHSLCKWMHTLFQTLFCSVD